jgi:glycosyltransferase involved in cell wall biosynthesis
VIQVSAVICTRNRPDLIGGAVASLLANDHKSFELLVIDQSADDFTAQALAPHMSDSRLRYVHLDRVGLSSAYNHGISLAKAPLLAFTDDDCVTPPDWLTCVEQEFAVHPDIDMLYGQTLAAPDLKGLPGVLPSIAIGKREKLGVGYGFRIYGMGADFAMRKSLVNRIGGFDEALGGGGPLRSSQDFDFQFRVFRSGGICLLSPKVWVHHYGIRDAQSWPLTQVAYGVGDGAFYFKHVRCGDRLALWLLCKRLARLSLHQLLNPIRRRPSEWPYLRSYFIGIARSLRFRIDRETRLYRNEGSAR